MNPLCAILMSVSIFFLLTILVLQYEDAIFCNIAYFLVPICANFPDLTYPSFGDLKLLLDVVIHKQRALFRMTFDTFLSSFFFILWGQYTLWDTRDIVPFMPKPRFKYCRPKIYRHNFRSLCAMFFLFFCIPRSNWAWLYYFDIWLFTSSIFYTIWAHFERGTRHRLLYTSQSGKAYWRAKFEKKREKKLTELKRSINNVEEKKRAAKSADTKSYDPTINHLKSLKSRYESHSGSVEEVLSFYSPILGYLRSILRFRFLMDFRALYQAYQVSNNNVQHVVRNVVRDIPNTSDIIMRSRINFSTFSISSKFDVNNIEKWCTLAAGLITSTSFINAGALLLTHFKTYYNKSVALELSGYFTKLFTHDPIYEVHSMQDIVTMWRTLCTDFKSLQRSPLFDKVLGVISLIVSSGLCGTFDIDFKVAGFTIFSESLKKRLVGLTISDMPGLLLETVAYFLETGYLCYTQKSFRPILFSTPEAYEFEIKYLDYYRILPLACDGDWEASGTTYTAFLDLYEELYNYLHGLHSVLNKGFEKKIIWDRLVALASSKNDLDRRVNAGVMRKSPFVLAFCGPSSVGKTSIANIINVVAVKASGGSGELSKKITWNENDDYFSNYKADTETIVMDDMCNTKAAFMQTSPLMWLIKFNNNNPEYAVMADLPSKGKLAIRPHTLVITTNVEDLMAQTYSNEPVSILRRLDMRVTVSVKPEFSLQNGGSGSAMLDPIKATRYVDSLSADEKVFPDMWNLTVQKAVSIKNPTPGKPDQAVFKTIVWDGILLENVSLKVVADYTACAAGDHARTQSKLVSKQTLLHETINLCPVCTRLSISCSCIMSKQAGSDVNGGVDMIDVEPMPFAHIDIPDLHVENVEVEPGDFDWLWFLPYTYQINFAPFLRYMLSLRFVFDYIRINWFITSIQVFVLVVCILPQRKIGYVCYLLYTILALLALFVCVRMYYYYWLTRERINFMRAGARRLSRNPMFVAVVGLGTTYLMSRTVGKVLKSIIKLWSVLNRVNHENHSSLSPGTPEEYSERRKEKNCWYPTLPYVKLTNPTLRAKTSTWRDLAGKVPRNCVFVKNGTKVTGGFYIRTHMLVLPNHFITPEMDLSITPRVITDGNRHTYNVRTTSTFVYHVPDSDLAILYAPGGTDKYDVTDYLPSEFLSGTSVNSFFYRGHDGRIISERVTAKYGVVRTDAATFSGSEYVFDKLKTFKGLCMGVFVSETKPPQITGFHLGGLTGTGKGASGTLLRHHIYDAMEYFEAPGVIFPGSSTDIPTQMYEKHIGTDPFTLDRPIAPRCSTNYLPKDGIVEVLTSCKGAVTNKSLVITSHISDAVLVHTGVERMHGPAPMGPPEVRTWHNWSLGMQGFSTPSIGPVVDEIVRASVDYIKPLMCHFKNIRPLDLSTIINGLDNDKFLNRMPQNTSVGFPLSGKLSTYCVPLEPTLGHMVNWAVDDEIMEVYTIYKDKYRCGERCYPVFRASLKDEPVKISKSKVRVFQAAPVALKMILREYFLPIASHLSMFPLLSECAVGINPYNEEWDEMHKHIVKNGEDNIVAGDYSAYDQRMSSTLTSAAFSIMIELAAIAGYSRDDLEIMKSVAADVIYPIVAYNGTLVQLFGSNPSGHNLTVYVNSIVNSLISRCAFFKEYPTSLSFREAVSMMTYGDDDIGSVGPEWTNYNNISKSNYITSIGMVYTPPSKEGAHVRLMNIGEVDFLKRKSTYNEICGRYMGALESASIFKSLHVRMLSSEISDDQWAGSVVDSAIREMFAHGEENYERFRSQMIQVAEDCGFSPHSLNLLCTYEDMRDKIES